MSDFDFLESNFGSSDSDKALFEGNGSGSSSNQGYQNNQQQNQGGQQKSWGNKSGGNGGGWNNKPFDKEEWIRKQNEIQPPYMPIAVYIDPRNMPQEAIDKLVALCDKLLSHGFTVRYNADEKVLQQRINALSNKNIEDVIPFNEFNEMKSKFHRNTKTAESIAQMNNPAWDKLPKIVQILMTRNIRLLFGDRNFNNAKVLITWSPDGATKAHEVSQNTGKGNTGWMIKMAEKYHFPVLNINSANSMAQIKELLRGNE